MSYGSNEAVEEAEDEWRERLAQLIAQRAAEMVAARVMERAEALEAAAEWVRRERDTEGDVTGVAAIENVFPSPTKVAPPGQVAAIAAELLEPAREVAESL